MESYNKVIAGGRYVRICSQRCKDQKVSSYDDVEQRKVADYNSYDDRQHRQYRNNDDYNRHHRLYDISQYCCGVDKLSCFTVSVAIQYNTIIF